MSKGDWQADRLSRSERTGNSFTATDAFGNTATCSFQRDRERQ
ncbi:MAG: hypothetical protein U0176_11595 [Bacteroidia bacterium]